MTDGTKANADLFYTNNAPHKVDESELGANYEELSDDVRDAHFDLIDTIEWIRAGGYKRIALQFPDSLLPEAVPVSRRIETSFEDVKVFILADTSYRSCCVDEVAARHASCDALVHYGDACLSAPTQNIPVRYVLGQLPVDLTQFEKALSTIPPSNLPCFLLTDSSYAHLIDGLSSSSVSALQTDVLPCRLSSRHRGRPNEGTEVDANEIRCLGRVLPDGFAEAEEAQLVFVGSQDSPLLPLWLLSHPHCSRILHYDPTTPDKCTINEPSSWRALRRRLFMVEKVRDAYTIGLVIGTVGVAGHREAVQRVRALAKADGKKVYVISVGKINVAKLANFSADVDCFVLLSCPFGVLLDTSSFDKPVVSLFEAEIALNKNKDWMAGKGWTSDYVEFVKDPTARDASVSRNDDGDEDAAPDMSLVSGRVRVRVDREENAKEGDGVDTVALYTAGDYFAARSWRGLDDSTENGGDAETTAVGVGRKGRAACYENEP